VVESRLIIGAWEVNQAANSISSPSGTAELEPRVMDLLMLLAAKPGDVVLKEEIVETLWGNVHVNEDALTRCVFKLRKVLGDDARNPKYIATVSKRGYRLIADVSVSAEEGQGPRTRINPKRAIFIGVPAILALALLISNFLGPGASKPSATDPENGWLARADGFYSQYTRTDNEAALRLYEAVLDDEPRNAAALAGLSNALTQRVIRYQGPEGNDAERGSLTEAIESGWLNTSEANATLRRAVDLARRSTELDPSHDRAWRALGLALSAQTDFADAERAYERALVIDPDDWGTMINLSELYQLTDRADLSTPYLEQAWFAMERRFDEETVSIRPWHSAIGISVAARKAAIDELEESRLWYRRVLARDPLNSDAVRGLAETLKRLGDESGAAAVCAELAGASDERC
jgi:transcriptional activator of cad operon